jgi:hypothetical protein
MSNTDLTKWRFKEAGYRLSVEMIRHDIDDFEFFVVAYNFEEQMAFRNVVNFGGDLQRAEEHKATIDKYGFFNLTTWDTFGDFFEYRQESDMEQDA